LDNPQIPISIRWCAETRDNDSLHIGQVKAQLATYVNCLKVFWMELLTAKTISLSAKNEAVVMDMLNEGSLEDSSM
jgi:hypothetical protein